MRTVLLDTNVLIADPNVLFAFNDAEIIIPETVLGELDKLKTSRADADLRFRGREVSRTLFELSEQGSLIGGVEMPDGGTLRVVPFDADADLPDGLSTRNADDKILAVAYQVCKDHCEHLTVITNDLNMLLKAQSLGLNVKRYGDGVEGSFARRFIIRPFQRYRIPLAILGMSLGVFAAIVFIAMSFRSDGGLADKISVPPELRETFTASQLQIHTLLQEIENNPESANALLDLGNIYFELGNYPRASTFYERYVTLQPDNLDAATDLAASYFSSGKTDQAILAVNNVLAKNPEHVKANFNLGVMLWQGKGDLPAAKIQFQRVVELTVDSTDPTMVSVNKGAMGNIVQIDETLKGGSQGTTGGA
ncbi:MAG: tetratricopeptide repeat protein [Actinobacteria bacterium]|nr:tetratricopeptide repeat protein [Actinomycetota bacterium]MCG2807824.1 PIN domain-containing protein [Coriobacteriia bacterium]